MGLVIVTLSQSNELENDDVKCMVRVDSPLTKGDLSFEISVQSLSLSAGQREITGWLFREGYTPVSNWTQYTTDMTTETTRYFRK